MKLNEMKSLTTITAKLLEADDWTVEALAEATPKQLISYQGIGKITASRIIKEATEIVNLQGLEDSERLETEGYYLKAPPEKILRDWEDEGLPIQDVAMASAAGLTALKGVEINLAYALISKAMDIVNREMLYKSKQPFVYGGQPDQGISSAFDERWLSGEVEPPPMSVRVRRNFDEAKEAYEARNG